MFKNFVFFLNDFELGRGFGKFLISVTAVFDYIKHGIDCFFNSLKVNSA